MAMALFAMAVMLGPAVGPTLGGWIVDNYSWPWIFYINIPVGILGLVMVARSSTRTRRSSPRTASSPRRSARTWTGGASGCMVVGLCSLQYVLEEGQQERLVPVEAHPR